jgi:hypothetical protein
MRARFALVLGILAMAIATFGSPPLAPQSAAGASTPPAKAPADEYFGKLNMSLLGVNNVYHDVSIRAGSSTTDPNLINLADDATEALSAWAHKYPHDPDLARSYYLAFRVYAKIWTIDAQQRAWTLLNAIPQRWPSSYFAKLVKADLAIGFTEHYYAAALPCPTPTPTPAPTATPSPTPSPSPSPTPAPKHRQRQPQPTPAPTPSPTPTPMPTPTPTPTTTTTPNPTPTPLPGHPRIVIVPAPCLTPSS